MSDILLVLPDGSERSVPSGTTGREVAESIGPRLAQAAVAVSVAGQLLDTARPLTASGAFAVITAASPEGRHVLRHSTAHVLAQAVLDLYPGATFAIGPAIDDGFYYDFDLAERITESDLDVIDARMRDIVAADQRFEREDVSMSAGMKVFADHPYKREIIDRAEPEEGAGADSVSLYRNDDFVDLCRGPHVPSTGYLGHFALQRVAGAYWRGDVAKPQLQRIYGTAWESAKALADHLEMVEEARARDHRKLGSDLDLFSFNAELGAGLALWHPRGGAVRRVMEDYSRDEHELADYKLVYTPHIGRSNLWETSGHLEQYADDMYPPITVDDDHQYYIKPMNCPFHALIYRSHLHSYRELPLRYYELGTVYRYELSGAGHGLTRPRGFTQDDSHIFCTPDQLVPELASLLEFVLRILRTFGLTRFEAELQTRPEKFIGSIEDWDLATGALRQAVEGSGLEYVVAEGEGTFYAPKVSVHIRDALGRRWQLSTLQVDLQMAPRFDLTYTGADNQAHRPYVIHRALFGSVERFFSILVEHYAGAFPFWLAPLQVAVLPVADRHADHASGLVRGLREARIRTELRPADETLGNRIRVATEEKVPYMLIVGDDDVDNGTLGVRSRDGRDRRGVPVDELMADLAAAARTRQ